LVLHAVRVGLAEPAGARLAQVGQRGVAALAGDAVRVLAALDVAGAGPADRVAREATVPVAGAGAHGVSALVVIRARHAGERVDGGPAEGAVGSRLHAGADRRRPDASASEPLRALERRAALGLLRERALEERGARSRRAR